MLDLGWPALEGWAGVLQVEGSRTERLCRQTQTVDTQQRSAQTRREAAVQMARPDVLLDDSLDRVVAPSELYCMHQNPADAHSAL